MMSESGTDVQADSFEPSAGTVHRRRTGDRRLAPDHQGFLFLRGGRYFLSTEAMMT